MEKSIKLVKSDSIESITYYPRSKHEVFATEHAWNIAVDNGKYLYEMPTKFRSLHCPDLDLEFYPHQVEVDPLFKRKRKVRKQHLYEIAVTAEARLDSYLQRVGSKLESNKSTCRRFIIQKPRIVVKTKDNNIIETFSKNKDAKARLDILQSELVSNVPYIRLKF